ncbi:hypothetical protein V8C86DRAFT_3130719 [Haematococcus lacustris]
MPVEGCSEGGVAVVAAGPNAALPQEELVAVAGGQQEAEELQRQQGQRVRSRAQQLPRLNTRKKTAPKRMPPHQPPPSDPLPPASLQHPAPTPSEHPSSQAIPDQHCPPQETESLASPTTSPPPSPHAPPAPSQQAGQATLAAPSSPAQLPILPPAAPPAPSQPSSGSIRPAHIPQKTLASSPGRPPRVHSPSQSGNPLASAPPALLPPGAAPSTSRGQVAPTQLPLAATSGRERRSGRSSQPPAQAAGKKRGAAAATVAAGPAAAGTAPEARQSGSQGQDGHDRLGQERASQSRSGGQATRITRSSAASLAAQSAPSASAPPGAAASKQGSCSPSSPAAPGRSASAPPQPQPGNNDGAPRPPTAAVAALGQNKAGGEASLGVEGEAGLPSSPVPSQPDQPQPSSRSLATDIKQEQEQLQAEPEVQQGLEGRVHPMSAPQTGESQLGQPGEGGGQNPELDLSPGRLDLSRSVGFRCAVDVVAALHPLMHHSLAAQWLAPLFPSVDPLPDLATIEQQLALVRGPGPGGMLGQAVQDQGVQPAPQPAPAAGEGREGAVAGAAESTAQGQELGGGEGAGGAQQTQLGSYCMDLQFQTQA